MARSAPSVLPRVAFSTAARPVVRAAVRAAVVVLVAAVAGACTPTELLGPDAAQGIEGRALRGPTCPVQTPGADCAPRPHQARIDVRTAEGKLVGWARSREDGRFRIGLVPGDYVLVPEPGDPFPHGSEEEVTVEAGVWAEVTVRFDTGIR